MKSPFQFAILSFAILFAAPSWAFRVSPMVVNFSPSGVGSEQTVTVENTGSSKIILQVEAFHRFMDEEGKETRTPTDEFNIYPEQISLQPKEKRSIRVSWVGSRNLDRELGYRLAVSELPAELPVGTPKPRLSILMQYVVSLYVTPGLTPKQGSAHVVTESFKVLPNGMGELRLKNMGLAHQLLKGIRVFVSSLKENRVEIKGEKIQALEGANILALSSLRLVFPLPAALIDADRAKPGCLKAIIQLN